MIDMGSAKWNLEGRKRGREKKRERELAGWDGGDCLG